MDSREPERLEALRYLLSLYRSYPPDGIHPARGREADASTIVLLSDDSSDYLVERLTLAAGARSILAVVYKHDHAAFLDCMPAEGAVERESYGALNSEHFSTINDIVDYVKKVDPHRTMFHASGMAYRFTRRDSGLF